MCEHSANFAPLRIALLHPHADLVSVMCTKKRLNMQIDV